MYWPTLIKLYWYIPAVLSQYLKYVTSLGFETKPNYSYCRDLLKQGIEESGYVDDGKLVFGAVPRPKLAKSKKVCITVIIFKKYLFLFMLHFAHLQCTWRERSIWVFMDFFSLHGFCFIGVWKLKFTNTVKYSFISNLQLRNVLTRRREYGTYLATARRHRRRIKMQKRESSSTADEGHSARWKLRYSSIFCIFSLLRCLRAVAR